MTSLINKIVNSIWEGKVGSVKQNLDRVLTERAVDVLESRKVKVARAFFGEEPLSESKKLSKIDYALAAGGTKNNYKALKRAAKANKIHEEDEDEKKESDENEDEKDDKKDVNEGRKFRRGVNHKEQPRRRADGATGADRINRANWLARQHKNDKGYHKASE